MRRVATSGRAQPIGSSVSAHSRSKTQIDPQCHSRRDLAAQSVQTVCLRQASATVAFRCSIRSGAEVRAFSRWSAAIRSARQVHRCRPLSTAPTDHRRGPAGWRPFLASTPSPTAVQAAAKHHPHGCQSHPRCPGCFGNPGLSCRGTNSSNPSPSSDESGANSRRRSDAETALREALAVVPAVSRSGATSSRP